MGGQPAPAQHEIDFRYGNALHTADNLTTFKYVVRRVARDFGLHATFMPKPIFGINGSGMHIHLSLFSADGQTNLFDDPGSEWERSAEDYDQRRADPDRAPWTTELHGKAVSDSQIGKFREILSPEDIAIIEEECQAVMRPFKYDTLAAQAPSA